MSPESTYIYKEYTCTITLVFTGNGHEAINEEDYKEKVKASFYDEYGIKLANADISNIQQESQ